MGPLIDTLVVAHQNARKTAVRCVSFTPRSTPHATRSRDAFHEFIWIDCDMKSPERMTCRGRSHQLPFACGSHPRDIERERGLAATKGQRRAFAPLSLPRCGCGTPTGTGSAGRLNRRVRGGRSLIDSVTDLPYTTALVQAAVVRLGLEAALKSDDFGNVATGPGRRNEMGNCVRGTFFLMGSRTYDPLLSQISTN